MSVRVSGSRPSVLKIVIAYRRASVPTARIPNHDQRRSSRFILTTRRLPGQISQNCRAPPDLSRLRWTSLAAAAGTPSGDNSSLISLHTSMSRTSTIRSDVTYNLLELFPSNPAKTTFGSTLRHGELTSTSHPSAVLRSSSPDLWIRPPHSEYTVPNPSKSPE